MAYLVQPVALFAFNSTTTSVKFLGFLPLFAAVIAKLILCSSLPCFFVVDVQDNGKENIFFFVYTASQTAHFLTAMPSLP